MSNSIWGRDPIYIIERVPEEDMTGINMGLVVEAEMVITHADGTTDADEQPAPVEVAEIEEGE